MRTIVFIHGYMNTGAAWKDWQAYFEQRGYRCLAPSWSYLDREIADLQANPDPCLAQLTFADVVAHYQTIIDQLEERPILIGHSLGGVVVQKLVEKGYAGLAIAIASGPPKGIFAWNKDFLLSNLQLTWNPRGEATVLMSPNWYHRYVINHLTLEESQAFVAENCVPAGRKIAKTIEKIDFSRPHVPLLFIAGAEDKSQPAVINQKNAQAYQDSSSQVTYRVFSGRTHQMIQQKGWQEVAEFVEEWIKQQE